MTFSAVFGFKYPDQCILLWIIAGGIVFMVCSWWGVKCYLHNERDTAAVQPADNRGADGEADNKQKSTDFPNDEDEITRSEDSKLLAFVF